MNTFSLVAILIAAYALLEIFSKKLLGRGDVYTRESAERFAPIEGCLLMMVAIGIYVVSMAGEGSTLPAWTRPAGLIVLACGAIADLIIGQKMLVKRDRNSL